MRENTNHRVQPKTLDMASLECLREFEEHLNQTGFSRRFIATCIGAARHLLVWLELDGSEVKAVDNAHNSAFSRPQVHVPAARRPHRSLHAERSAPAPHHERRALVHQISRREWTYSSSRRTRKESTTIGPRRAT